MKKRHKLGLIGAGLFAALFILSSCTASFCTNKEKSRILFAMEPGVSEYFESEEAARLARDSSKYKDSNGNLLYSFTNPEQLFKEEGNNNVWRMVAYNKTATKSEFYKSKQLTAINEQALKNGFTVPNEDYFIALDNEVLNLAIDAAGASRSTLTCEDLLGKQVPASGVSTDTRTIHQMGILETFGYLKFTSESGNDLYDNLLNITSKLKIKLGEENCPSSDYASLYMSQMNTVINNYRACITTISGDYGAYGQDYVSIHIEGQDWGQAWTKGGAVIEGIIVYPVAWLVDQFAYIFAGGANVKSGEITYAYQSGVPQLLALVLVTVIVRLFIFLVTFKSTMSQQKMQRLQPELSKIQAKYPNSNTNKAQKQRLAEEQMKLYKKNKVNPLSALITLVIQFPVFIGVWGAMTGSAVLSTGAFLNLNLSTSIWNCLTYTSGLPSNSTGWWTALVLIILMSVSQFISMKLPQWITKAKTKNVTKLGKNPAQKSQNKTMTIVSYGMLIMIIIMGFTLPAAMGVYWLIGALFSVLQTIVTQLLIKGKKHNN